MALMASMAGCTPKLATEEEIPRKTKYTRLQPADRGGAAPGAGLHVSPRPQCFSLVRQSNDVDQGGAAPGAGLHVSSRLQLFSLVSGKVMTLTPR